MICVKGLSHIMNVRVYGRPTAPLPLHPGGLSERKLLALAVGEVQTLYSFSHSHTCIVQIFVPLIICLCQIRKGSIQFTAQNNELLRSRGHAKPHRLLDTQGFN